MDEMMEVLQMLKGSVDREGLVKVAGWLEHKDTQTIKRWIRKNEIPQNQVRAVKVLINLEGCYERGQ